MTTNAYPNYFPHPAQKLATFQPFTYPYSLLVSNVVKIMQVIGQHTRCLKISKCYSNWVQCQQDSVIAAGFSVSGTVLQLLGSVLVGQCYSSWVQCQQDSVIAAGFSVSGTVLQLLGSVLVGQCYSSWVQYQQDSVISAGFSISRTVLQLLGSVLVGQCYSYCVQ